MENTEIRWMNYEEMAAELGISYRSVRRYASEPEKYGLMRREKGPGESGRDRILLARLPEAEKPVTDFFSMAADAEYPDIEDAPLHYQFRWYLHKKLVGKSGSALRQTRKYYTDLFKKTGIIPEALKEIDGRKTNGGSRCGGRAATVTPEAEARFVEMVRESALSDPSDPKFMTQRLRKIINYQRRLQQEFGRKISRAALYRLVKTHSLKRYLDKPDYEGEVGKVATYFNPVPVFDLVQMDGMTFKWLEIRDKNGNFRQPQVIEFYDTGSRYMLAMDAYMSESNEESVDIFCKFLTSTPFPDKKIRVRPDNAKGFLNLRRPIHHLNRDHSRPDKFFMDADFARVRAPKHKVHLESSHRALHNFEDQVILALPQEKIIESKKAVKFINGKQISGTVRRFDCTIEELRATGIIEKYREEHNTRMHNFSEGGITRRWIPAEKLGEYLRTVECLKFTEADTEKFKAYGYPKTKATVRRDGTLTYKNRQWQTTDARFMGIKTRVRVSDLGEKLLIFEEKENGMILGSAMAVGPSTKPKFVETRSKDRSQVNDYDLISAYLEKSGMTVNHERLQEMYAKNLRLDQAVEMVTENRERYAGKAGFIAFHLFYSDFARAKQAETKVPEYANLRKEAM